MSPRHFLDLHLLPSPTVVEWWMVAQAILPQKAEDASPASGAQRPPGLGQYSFLHIGQGVSTWNKNDSNSS